MPPIQHICVVPHVCHWLHFIQVHPRIPVAHPVCPTWLTVQPVILSGPHIHCWTGHSARTGGGSDNRENIYKATCISKTRYLTSFIKSMLTSLVFYETHPQMKVLIITLGYT